MQLVEIFDQYSLRAKKQRDYLIWREAVMAKATMSRGGNNASRSAAWRCIEKCHVALRATKQYDETMACLAA